MLKNENFDYVLKIISISVFLFLTIIYVFNLGYFLILGMKFTSLLELRDYYEGSAPLFTFSFLIISTCFCFLSFTKPLKKLPSYIRSLYYSILFIPITNLKCELRYRYSLIRYKKVYKKVYSCKKDFLKIKKELDNIRNENAKFILSFLFDFYLFILPLFLFVFPIYLFWTYVFPFCHNLFVVMTISYILFALYILINNNFFNRCIVIIFVLFSFVFMFGINYFLRNCSMSDTNVLLVNKQNKILIRTIKKGVIYKENEKNIGFVTWDKVEKIYKNFQ